VVEPTTRKVMLMTNDKPPSDTILIRNYFFEGMKAKEIAEELKQLSDEEKAALAEGIRNGTLTY
jgi:hypothetical protein